jgi:tetratricopeptide (TPR) repeat protein
MNDNLIYPLVVFPLFLSLIIVARLMTTFFHELGHAIPALAFTKGEVTVFLGSYGDVKKSVHLKINKRFSVHFRLNPLKWVKGMVQFGSNKVSVAKHMFILLLGPLFSLIIAAVAIYIIFSFDLNGFLKLAAVIFLVSAIVDLRNIYPSKTPIITDSGTITYCDGRQIVRILAFDKYKKELSLAYKLYAEEDYSSAAKIFEVLDLKFLTNDALDIMMTSFHKCKRYAKAKERYTILLELPGQTRFTSSNWGNLGLTESLLGEYDCALSYYNQSLELDENNMYSFLNRGFTYNLMGRYAEGLDDFNKALTIDPNFAYAYSNRAYSKIKLNAVDDAMADINRSIELDDKNSYAYRNLGLYYLEKGNIAEALSNLKLAYDLDPDTHSITDYIKEAEGKLKSV